MTLHEPVPEPRAPRLFNNNLRTAEDWATINNPYPPGTHEFYQWSIAYWNDLGRRYDRVARRWLTVSIVSFGAATILNLAALLIRFLS